MPAGALRGTRSGEGLGAAGCVGIGAFATSAPGLARPDPRLHFVVGIVDDDLRRVHPRKGFSAHVGGLRPASRGTVRLASADRRAAPLVDPARLSAPEDAESPQRGAVWLRRIPEAAPRDPWRGEEIRTAGVPDAGLREAIRTRADAIHHPVGICRMGGDAAPRRRRIRGCGSGASRGGGRTTPRGCRASSGATPPRRRS